MKTKFSQVIILLVGSFTVCLSHAQGTFRNLDFESPIGPLDSIYPPNYGAFVYFTNAFPGWVGYVGQSPATVSRLDGVNLDDATHAILRGDYLNVPLIEGGYTAVLQAGRDPNNISQVTLVSVQLAQSGLVPTDSHSLQFLAYTAGTPFAVTLGGVNIPVVDLETFPKYHRYGGDISSFAGSFAELRFTAFSDNYPGSTVFALDSIQFSNLQIPEPSTFALVGLGAVLLGWRWRTNRKP